MLWTVYLIRRAPNAAFGCIRHLIAAAADSEKVGYLTARLLKLHDGSGIDVVREGLR